MAGEPWCFTPEQIGRLTDWQILELYAKPAADRADRITRTPAKPAGAQPAPAAEPGTPEHRRQVIDGMVNTMGWKPERAAAAYDRQLAQWRAEQGAG